MVVGQRYEFDGLRREVVARLQVAHGGGNPYEDEVVVVRDDGAENFVVAYCQQDSMVGKYQHAVGFRHRLTADGIAEEYVKALQFAVRRAELR